MCFKIKVMLRQPDEFEIGHFGSMIRRELLVITEAVHQLRVLIDVIMQIQNNIIHVGYAGHSLRRNLVNSFIYTSHEALQSMYHLKSIVPTTVKIKLQPIITELEKKHQGIVRARDSVAHSNERRAGRERKKNIEGSIYHGVQNDTFIEFQDSRGRFGLDVSEQTVNDFSNAANSIVCVAKECVLELQEP